MKTTTLSSLQTFMAKFKDVINTNNTEKHVNNLKVSVEEFKEQFGNLTAAIQNSSVWQQGKQEVNEFVQNFSKSFNELNPFAKSNSTEGAAKTT
ncbi:hypothetical protein U1Q18_046518 [Sarracenia purpurea var. burkii]